MPKLLEQKQWDKIYLFLKDFPGIYCGSDVSVATSVGILHIQ
ncbi:hypothetical protein Psal071_00748 [Piscirickettsia salmonis]|uniref:Uncharacterized protein n=1 Tax=Piscirickettsia salmonis TaxID=1238 RepID=A0A9Q6LS84_PISSA|nr:hypothetical protein KW89_715 [Piscirickettsia salmonis]ALA25533.1 hypothetical protein KW89_2067 [Piscirickettsia salmonis]QGN76554.1 hypothetical protein Psal001_00737 [Piscirickettsia salmonis]QGN80144.1 hypothetical protein Psal002_00762 [Piscirickettsia salmonis]QGN85583.1 hypothetical protein Psal003_02669 [Piscirickettsia salmonis]